MLNEEIFQFRFNFFIDLYHEWIFFLVLKSSISQLSNHTALQFCTRLPISFTLSDLISLLAQPKLSQGLE